jgi:hypothetical protein
MATLNLAEADKNIYKNGAVVGTTDANVLPDAGYFNIPDILVKGRLDGELEYSGKVIKIEQVEQAVGFEVGKFGARGPVWKNVKARIVS